MLLNLAIVKDALQGCQALQAKIDSHAKRELRYPRYYAGEKLFSSQVLYIAQAGQLATDPTADGHAAIICLGYPPMVFSTLNCDCLCLEPSTDLDTLFRKVQEIFFSFADFDSRIKDKIIENRPVSELADIALSLFHTPVTVFDKFEKILMIAYDPGRPENLEFYQNCLYTYMPEDERSVLYTDQDFATSLETRGATWFQSDIYKQDIIFYNIFIHNNLYGRVIIEDTYRNLRDGDYALLEWFGCYVQTFLAKSTQYYYHTSIEFERMMQAFLLQEGPYLAEYDQVLTLETWQPNDLFLCVSVTNVDLTEGAEFLNNGAFYMEDLFAYQYIFIQDRYITQIINVTRSQYPQIEILRRLNAFLKNNEYAAGTSTWFSDFSQTKLYISQSRLMADYAVGRQTKKLYEFNQDVLPMAMSLLDTKYHSRLYYTDRIRELISYDTENGTELVKTLKCYVENNLNITKTYEQMYIARTTCLYRLKRISQITHMDPEDPCTNLYLRVLFYLMKI